jgi:hypothetical protein
MPMSPRLLRPRAASGFDPRSITGLLAWYDVADMSTLAQNSNGTTAASAENDPVGYLKDKGPNGYHMTQSTNNARPLLKLAAQSGRPALLFDGNDDFLINTNNFLNGLRPSAAFIGQRQSDNPLNRTNQLHAVCSAGRSGAAGERIYNGGLRNTFNAGTVNHVFITGGNTRRNGAASLDTGTAPTAFSIATGADGPAGNTVLVQNSGDGVILGAARDGVGSIGGGGAVQLAFWLSGRIGEVILYNRVLTLAERQALERYLSGKWGITLTL